MKFYAPPQGHAHSSWYIQPILHAGFPERGVDERGVTERRTDPVACRGLTPTFSILYRNITARFGA